jgi:fructokinase
LFLQSIEMKKRMFYSPRGRQRTFTREGCPTGEKERNEMPSSEVRSSSAYILPGTRLAGLELGGTKCIAVLAEGGRIIDRLSVPTSHPDEVLAALADRLKRWHDEAPFAALGIASFGPVGLDRKRADYGYITSTPKPGWKQTSVVGYFQDLFSVAIGFDTDVTGAAIAEHRWGLARGLNSNVYLTIGTGLGGGAVIEGRPVHGLLHPEMGHVRVRRAAGDEFGGTCPFHGDCLEGLVCGPAIAARAGRSAAELSPEDPLWIRIADEIAELLATLVLTLSPQRIAIGGGVGVGQPQLLPMMRAGLLQRLAGYVGGVDAESVETLVAPACFGDEAGLLGAIALGDLALAENGDAG